MSRDLSFWKQDPALELPRGAVALAVGEHEVPGLLRLDERGLLAAIDQRFPGWRGERIDHWKFECDVQSTSVALTLHGGTPAEVEAWFRDRSRREGLTVFDHASERISPEERRAYRALVAAARRELQREEAEEARRDYAELLARAEAGDPAAGFAVGQRLSFGEGVDAVELGQVYAAGEGVPADAARAAALFETARANGHPEARKALRLLMERG